MSPAFSATSNHASVEPLDRREPERVALDDGDRGEAFLVGDTNAIDGIRVDEFACQGKTGRKLPRHEQRDGLKLAEAFGRVVG